MNGRDLLEAMSFLDEDLVAASDAPARIFPWKQVISLAACFCILLLGAFSFLRNGQKSQTTESASDTFSIIAAGVPQMDAGQPETAAAAESAPQETYEAESLSILIRMEELTETGFQGTALEDGPNWKQGDSIAIEYSEGFLPDSLTLGAEYRVWMESFDAENRSAVISQLEPID